tara:strand:+ start:130 stop:456 length:327 start_codon:yes stop_codon:yes gene_type:complete
MPPAVNEAWDAKRQIWFAFRRWLGCIVGAALVTGFLLVLGERDPNALLVGWLSAHAAILTLSALDFVTQRKWISLAVIVGLSLASGTAGVAIKVSVDSPFVHASELER